ncbi:coq1 putative hexaprenyl diphosphate synthase [Mycoemilia scoparia]|uniref:Coq1 putative hexaprenyl diphosphate synthase n=1 Tax=Mycoemilia scoparia TaxID=417184 RepID=A0A9W8DMT4_9FUNG|nr:coq1 putative hexaprenyl diphosphate synthase [Mycoemilia scoparia]
MASPKTKATFNQIATFFRRILPNPSESRPLAKFAVGNAKVAHFLESATAPSPASNSSSATAATAKGELFKPPNIEYINRTSSLLEELRKPILASTVLPLLEVPKFTRTTSTVIKALSKNHKEALKAGSNLVGENDSAASGGNVLMDPAGLVGADLKLLTGNIKRLLSSGHPALNTVTKYYFGKSGKQIRPLLVLLVAQATSITTTKLNNGLMPDALDNIDYSIYDNQVGKEFESDPESKKSNDLIKKFDNENTRIQSYSASISSDGQMTILPTQRRLAEICEMIHTATLLHDDVIDQADTRRGAKAVQQVFGNKMAILAGDFMLARSSVMLARLRDPKVIDMMSSVISDLVEGEFKQLRNTLANNAATNAPDEDTFKYYMEKTYLKTASLIAKGCQGSAYLGQCSNEITEAAYIFGRNLGLAFQLVDDMLDFTGSQSMFGKPVGADLNLGLATAPVLYAWQEYPQLGPLVHRKFSKDGDSQMAYDLVHSSRGIAKTRQLAYEHAQRAIQALSVFPPSPARDALENITETVLTRQK